MGCWMRASDLRYSNAGHHRRQRVRWWRFVAVEPSEIARLSTVRDGP
jgi:hypothetical protein